MELEGTQRTEGYVDTYYTRSLLSAVPSDQLLGEVEADVCIVGGGVAGISAAWELTSRGLKVVVLEARRVAWGASGRNGGILSSGFAASSDLIARHVGAQGARDLHELSAEGVEIVLNNTETLGLKGVNPTQGVIAASRHANSAGTRDWQEAARSDDTLMYLPPKNMRDLVKSDRFHDGLLDNAGYHIHPLNYCVGLATKAVEQGARIFENTAMVSMQLVGNNKVVHTAEGSVKAQHVVLCGSGYSGVEFGRLHRAIVPIATYVVSTRDLGARANDIMATRAAVSDTRLSCDYFRITPEGELLWGGGMSALRKQPGNLAALMKARIVDVFPQLADVEIALSWTGVMGYARHKMPYLQQIDPNVWVMTAFGGHGLNTAPCVARVLSEAIAEEGQRHEMFRPFALRWNGGVLGQITAESICAASNLGHRIREWRQHP